jgi:hypothetical protein
MKIQPIPTSQGAAGVSTTSTGTESTSPDRKAAALAAFKGESQVKLTESDTPVDPQVKTSVRTIRMTTTATPGPRDALDQVADPKQAETASVDPSTEIKGSVEETKPLDPQRAELAKVRRALQVKEREIADREKALAAKESQTQPDLVAKLKANPLGVLREAGVTYDQLTESLLADQSGLNPEIQTLKAELKAVKDSIDKTLSDRDLQQEQQVLAEIDRNVSSLVAEGDQFEMIRVTGSQADVRELIHRTFKATGEVLSESEAAQLVEDALVKENLKIAGTKKIQTRLAPQRETAAPVMRTLTSRGNAAPRMSRKERALAAFYGTLRK